MMELSGKRIIFVLNCLRLGGAENLALLLATYLQNSQKMDVEVWGFDKPDRVSELCDQRGIKWRSVSKPRIVHPLYIFPDFIRFSHTLRNGRPDILMPYTLGPNLACGFSWRLSGAKLCIWNQQDVRKAIWSTRLLERLAIRLTPFFISNSVGGAEVIKSFGAPSQSVRVIYNGVLTNPPQADRMTWRKRLNIDENYFLACMVANLSPYKDHNTLLHAWRLFLDRFANQPSRLLLAGRKDAAFPNLQKLSIELGIADRVDFLGPVDDVSGLLQAVDLGVYCSPSEGLPNAVIETMAAGLPIVASDIRGIREAIGDNNENQFFPNNRPDLLAERMLTIANDMQIRTSLGEANRKRALEAFNLDRLYSQTTDFLQMAIQYYER